MGSHHLPLKLPTPPLSKVFLGACELIWAPCLCRKLNSTIMVVKAIHDRHRCDAAFVLDGTMDWGVFAKRPMSPQLVVVSSILRKDSA